MRGRWMVRLGLLLLALLLLAIGSAWWYARSVLPQTEGRLTLPGLKAPLRIARDANGIATITAASRRDAMFGLGVVHAQDRLWQMETQRRIASGRLAEAFGAAALDTDRFVRILGARRAAQAQWDRASPAAREALEAYAEGVNALVASRHVLPPEFVALGLRAAPWTPVDSLAWSIMMAWDLSFNWQTELLRMRLALSLPKTRIDQLLPPYPGDAVPASADYTALYKTLKLDAGQKTALADTVARLMAAAPPSEVEGAGSNVWAIAGSRSATGKPLLASDPHLRLTTPALWYFVHLKAPGLDMAGASVPGVPGVLMGQNARIAWGFTNTGPDVQDVYLERIKPDDAAQYQTPDGWARFEARDEVIKVKGGAEVRLTVRETRHGPVISDAALAGAGPAVLGAAGTGGAAAPAAYALALRWTGLDADIDLVAAGLKMMAAGSVNEFIEASRGWLSPMQNMAVADADGHIALVSSGRVPLRKPDNDLLGLAPAPGWDARYDWIGFVPFDELPRQVDPPSGYVANANQKAVAVGYPHYINAYWALPFRHQRITQLIEAKPKLSLDDLRAIQADQTSLAARLLLPRFKAARSGHPLYAAAAKAIDGFDGRMAPDSTGALVFWAWARHLSERVLVDELGRDLYERALSLRGYFDGLADIMARDDAWWCDDKATPQPETCAMQGDAALTAALDELQKLQGGRVDAWRWDRTHQARSEHRPFSRVPQLAPLFEQRQPIGGDTYTVNVSRVALRADAATGEFYLSDHGPSLRALYDLAERGNARVVHSTGQSGIAWSPLYRNFGPLWREVQGVALVAADNGRSQVLDLLPAGQ